MGLVVSDRDNYTSELHTNVDADLNYHTSWDWLMPVITTLKQHDWFDEEVPHIIDHIDNALTCCWGIDAVHRYTVDAIISYNKWNTYFRGERYNK